MSFVYGRALQKIRDLLTVFTGGSCIVGKLAMGFQQNSSSQRIHKSLKKSWRELWCHKSTEHTGRIAVGKNVYRRNFDMENIPLVRVSLPTELPMSFYSIGIFIEGTEALSVGNV